MATKPEVSAMNVQEWLQGEQFFYFIFLATSLIDSLRKELR